MNSKVSVVATPTVVRVNVTTRAADASPEGTTVLSTGETGGTKYLREDGDGTSSWQTVAGAAGDMEASTYDPTTVAGDAFDMDNMAEGATTKILTAAERTTIGTVAPHIADTANPHSVTKAQVGLTSVDDTADADKPVSTAQQTVLDLKQDILAEGAFVDGDKTKLDAIEAGADVTDATNVNAAGAVMESDFTPAFSMVVQQSGTGSPEMLQVGSDTLVGRVTGGGSEIDDLSPSTVRTMINVEDGATADQTDAEILTAVESESGRDMSVDGAKLDLCPTSDSTGVTGADPVTNMMSLTQAEYDAITTPDAATLYIIPE